VTSSIPGSVVGAVRTNANGLISTTIALLTVLIVFDGWQTLGFWQIVAGILGTVTAICLSNVFGAELGRRVAMGRRLTRRERRAVFVRESSLLLLAVPPLLILAVLHFAGVDYSEIIQVIILFGVFSLGAWGFVAGRRAKLIGWALVASTAYGLFLGAFILGIRAVLEPGAI
jgi:hypothetical protein